MLYTAKCFWPGAAEDDVRLAASRLGVAFRGALYLPADELVLCLVDSTSATAVKEASEHAGMPCERVIETVCIAPEARRKE
ncbi:MAG: nickel-binding protein [Gaiellaceae bacterium]